MINGPDDAALMTAIAERADRAAFAQLFARYAPRIKAHLSARGAATGAAEELTQEVMLVLWRKAALYDASRGGLPAWLYTISRNCLYNRLRGEQRREADAPVETPEPGDGASSSEEVLIALERQRALTVCLQKLPPEQREILEQAYWRGQTLQECAEERKIPLGTVKTRVRLALQRLRGLLKTRNDK